MGLKYFEFYHGNLTTGFDHIYGKQVADHAFLLAIPKTAGLPQLSLDQATVDFVRKRRDEVVTQPNLKKYIKYWQDVSIQWSNIDRRMHELVAEWPAESREVTAAPTDEWGLQLTDDQGERKTYLGANAYPENFHLFENWLHGYAKGRLR